jgi:hypothetical protein
MFRGKTHQGLRELEVDIAGVLEGQHDPDVQVVDCREPEELRAERLARAKKARRKKMWENAGVGVLGALLFLSVVAAIILLGGLVFWLAWNYGVVALVAAAGGSVGKIGFLTAVAGSLAVGILKGIFSANSRVEVRK